MKKVQLGQSPMMATRIAYGAWRIPGSWEPEKVTPEGKKRGRNALLTAFANGINLFDLADIYCAGVAEEIFGQVLREVPEVRGRILIATKCGIRRADDPDPGVPYRYDFSRDYIIKS